MCTIYQIFCGDSRIVDNTLEHVLEGNPNITLERYIPVEDHNCASGYRVLSVVYVEA
jgi:hypothetical protein